MATEVVIPPVGESITTVTLLQWLKGEGEEVRLGDILAELETDKATVSVESPADGTVLATLVQEGEETQVGRRIAVIGAAGESWTPERADGDKAQQEAPAAARREPPAATGVSRSEPRGQGEVRSAPSARRLARELGIDIREVAASLDGKRVTEADVRDFHAQRGGGGGDRGRAVTLSRIRTIVAERMSESARTIPQFSVSLEIDAGALLASQKMAAEEGGRVTFTAHLVWAACRGIDACPMINARYLANNRVLVLDERNIAVAAATDDGLVAPVIRDAARLSLPEISERLDTLVKRVRDGDLSPADLSDATFTISNLGALGAHRFTPMVVPGQSAILGVGAARRAPLITADGGVHAGSVFTATLTADHRVLDGADAMKFLKGMKDALETLQQ